MITLIYLLLVLLTGVGFSWWGLIAVISIDLLLDKGE